MGNNCRNMETRCKNMTPELVSLVALSVDDFEAECVTYTKKCFQPTSLWYRFTCKRYFKRREVQEAWDHFGDAPGHVRQLSYGKTDCPKVIAGNVHIQTYFRKPREESVELYIRDSYVVLLPSTKKHKKKQRE